MILGENIKNLEPFREIISKLSDKISDKSFLFYQLIEKIKSYLKIDKVFFFVFDKNISINTNNFGIYQYDFNKKSIIEYKEIYKETNEVSILLKNKLFNLNTILCKKEETEKIAKALENIFDRNIVDFSFLPLIVNNDKKIILTFLRENDMQRDSIVLYEDYLKFLALILSMVFDFELLHSFDKNYNNAFDTFDNNIIGESDALKNMLNLADRVAQTDATVLITGESGTGKELVATYIYQHSRRKNKPFITLNCAAIPHDLLENELFGHKKGAFTDAVDDYIGKFGQANGGTLFLDEIGELSFHLQAKLLRVLQYKVYEPIGSTKSYKTDVRLIAATNRDLLLEIKNGNFREDLFYRLNVVPIEVPPLRNRDNDVEILAKYFLKVYNKKHNKTIKGFTPALITLIKKYNWPGNVRELENFIQRVVVVQQKDYIDKEDFAILDENNTTKFIADDVDLKTAINKFKKEFIEKALINNDWNQTRTAKELKIQRTYLSRLIKELNINKL